MDQENKEYLARIQERAIAYDNTRAEVLEYVLLNRIKNNRLITNLFIIGFLHEANFRNEILSEQDLNILLGIDDDDDNFIYNEENTYFLEKSQKNLTLQELLEYTVKNFSVD